MKNLYYFLEKSTHINLKLQIMLLFISFSAVTIAQQHLHDHMDRCHTDETYSEMILANPEYAKNKKIIEREIQAILNNPNRQKDLNGIITIPVVYHVIHNGDAVGTNENLSTALLQAQLDQLTADFRRTNSDAGNTPADFTGVAADSEIEFCLTTIDETGAATSGITRHHINTFPGVNQNDCWTSAYINTNMKPSTIWDRDKYLNIWTVVKINRTSDCADTVLGYAQFPGGPSTTDGAVLRASTVGSIAMPNPGGGSFAIGRTGTHEVGHYLNLSHIWGSNGCTIGDNVSDTPSASGPNYIGSPCTYPGPNSCNDGIGDLPDMFQNYMDYSDDACFNLFTTGQKNRMHAAITASRPTLITAPCGATPANDLQTNAISIDCITATYTGTTITATSSDAPDLGSTCGTSISAPGVWYKMDGMHADVTLDLCQAPYDSKMNIYEDDGTGGLICIDGEDDDNNNCAGNFNDPYITFASEIGKTYYIYIQGFSGATGTFTMNVSCDCYNNVVNSNDSGPGSLRDVVACASDGDVITFDPSTNGQNIMLTSGQIVIDKSLTIQGNGMDNTIIDGALDIGNDSRVFRVLTSNTLSLHDITIQNAGNPNLVSLFGGAIFSDGDVKLVNSRFDNNKAFLGGAIRMQNGNLSMINCEFSDNLVDRFGGAINTRGTNHYAYNCLFYNNTSNDSGGALYNETGTWHIYNSTFTQNTATTGSAGGIRNLGTIDSLVNCIVYNNSATISSFNDMSTSAINAGLNNLIGIYTGSSLTDGVNGNISGDPLFVNATTDDFNLALNSPCFNTGNNAELPMDIFDIDGDSDTSEPLPTDISGIQARSISGTVDMGAYERIPDVCEDTYPILCGETLTEDITGYLVNFGCGPFTFQSKIHEFTATTSGTVTIDLSNFVGTKYLYLYDDNICGTTCNILSFSEAGGAMEQIVYPVTSGTTYYIEVYDFSGSGGTYQLSVTCETPCDTDLVFTSPLDDIASGMETFSTDENITSDINISGTSTEVIYSAGNTTLKSITLNAGFEVELGAEFEANMDGCLTAPLKSENGNNTIKRTDQSKRKSRK